MLVWLAFFWFPDGHVNRYTVSQPVFIEDTASTFFPVDVFPLIV